jgi:hypothetical protein
VGEVLFHQRWWYFIVSRVLPCRSMLLLTRLPLLSSAPNISAQVVSASLAAEG